MSERLTSQMLVSALLRLVQSRSGVAMVLQRGEPDSGAIVVQIVERGRNIGFFERIMSLDGTIMLTRSGPVETAEVAEIDQYIERRRRADPDIWIVELDVAEGQRLAAELLCAG
jgi:hypothetical protein